MRVLSWSYTAEAYCTKGQRANELWQQTIAIRVVVLGTVELLIHKISADLKYCKINCYVVYESSAKLRSDDDR